MISVALSWATDYADPIAGIALARPIAESPFAINLRAICPGRRDPRTSWVCCAKSSLACDSWPHGLTV